MDWSLILKVGGPIIVSLLKNLSTGLATDAPVTPSTTVRMPSQAIKDLQKLLNLVVDPHPPLVVDGWVGPKTEEAIQIGIAKLKESGIR